MLVGLLRRCYKLLSLLLIRVKWLYVLSPLQNVAWGCSRCPKKCLNLFWMIPGCFCCFRVRLVVFCGFWLFGMSDEVRKNYLPRPGECPSQLHNNIATLTTLQKEITGNSIGSDCFGCASSFGCFRLMKFSVDSFGYCRAGCFKSFDRIALILIWVVFGMSSVV